MKILSFFFHKKVFVFKGSKYLDNRGEFNVDINFQEINKISKQKIIFNQINRVISKKGVIRGIHIQIPPYEQDKIIYVINGKIQDIIIDLRKKSPTYGSHVCIELSKKNNKKIFIPKGFGHAYQSLENLSEVVYLTSGVYKKNKSKSILWNDKKINIKWRINKKIILSKIDKNGQLFR